MKTIVVTKRNQRGSVLLITIGITFIIGISLAGYLIMAQKQNLSVARSQTWNSSIALSEAGVEDALAMMNRSGGNFDILYTWTNSSALYADHWETVAANVYHTRRYLGSNYYDAYITNSLTTPPTPSIRSVGTVAWSFNSHASAPQSFFAAVSVNPPRPAALARKLEVRTKVDPLFNVAMAALKTIDFNGKNVMTDSFDSADPNFSNAGLYPSGNLNKTKAGGDVVTDDVIIGALDIGNAKIKGVVKTGPKGVIDIGDNGSVGDRAWVEGGNTGVQPGHATDDMNVLFDPVVLPIGATTWLAPSLLQQNVLIGGTTYTYAFATSGNYKLTSLGGKIYVAPGATVRLYVTGTASFSGLGHIDLMAGGTLKIYMGGNFSDTGNGFLNNYNQNAANFYLFGLPTCTDISLGGNANFTGVIYAPQADFHLNGSGVTTYDFVGASVSKSVQMNGNYKFHYDENLRKIGLGRGYIPTNWKEVQ